MARKGISTCKGCNARIPTVDANVYSGKKYCNDCYNIKMQQKQEYDNLINYTLNCFNIDKPTGLMLKQIKDYKEQFNYTIGGILYTLWYCKEIKNLKFEKKYGIAIVKYEYENAENYYIQQEKIKDSVKDIKHKKVKYITIESTINDNNKLLIDIDKLIQKDGV